MNRIARLASGIVLAGVAVQGPFASNPCDANEPGHAHTTVAYTVVVSEKTQADASWSPVVDALVKKYAQTYQTAVVTFEKSPAESLSSLKTAMPRYVCFVATPEEATKQFVADVSCLTRQLDADPYTDTLWGILTGYDAAGAVRIAQHAEPLVIRRVAGGTDVELAVCEEGVWYCELVKNRMVRKQPGGKPEQAKGPDDTTKALVDTLNEYKAQLFVTSGHATERDWQIGFRYRNGQFRCRDGQLFGLDAGGRRFPVDSRNPKVYMPIGNCLMGHIDSRQAMALAFMNSAGVHQMLGYTVPTWYGYAGWGCLDYFVEQPGRYTFAEAFFANQQALLHRLDTYFPGTADAKTQPGVRSRTRMTPTPEATAAGVSAFDGQGLLHDRDVLAFYGDPAWSARMAPGPLAFEQSLQVNEGLYTLQITPKRGERSFDPINTNGSQRGGRPIVELLPHRVENIEIIEGADLRPVITDDFLLIPNPGECDPKRQYRVVFRASRIGE